MNGNIIKIFALLILVSTIGLTYSTEYFYNSSIDVRTPVYATRATSETVSDNKSSFSIIRGNETYIVRYVNVPTKIWKSLEKFDITSLSCIKIKQVTSGEIKFGENTESIDIIPYLKNAGSLSSLSNSTADTLFTKLIDVQQDIDKFIMIYEFCNPTITIITPSTYIDSKYVKENESVTYNTTDIYQDEWEWWNVSWGYGKTFGIENLNDSMTMFVNTTVSLPIDTTNYTQTNGARLVFNNSENVSFFKNGSHIIFRTIKSISPSITHNYTMYWANDSVVTIFNDSDLNKAYLHFEDCNDISDMNIGISAWTAGSGICTKSSGLSSGSCGIHNSLTYTIAKPPEPLNYSGDMIRVSFEGTAQSNTAFAAVFSFIVSETAKETSGGVGMFITRWTTGMTFNSNNGSCTSTQYTDGTPRLITGEKSYYDGWYQYIDSDTLRANLSAVLNTAGTLYNYQKTSPLNFPQNFSYGNSYGIASWESNGATADNIRIYRDYYTHDKLITESPIEQQYIPSLDSVLQITVPINNSIVTSLINTFTFNITGITESVGCNFSIQQSGSAAVWNTNTSPISLNTAHEIGITFGVLDNNKSFDFNISCGFGDIGTLKNASIFTTDFAIGFGGDITNWGEATSTYCLGDDLFKEYTLSINSLSYYRLETVSCNNGCYNEKCRGSETEENILLIFATIILPLLVISCTDLTMGIFSTWIK